MVTSLLPSRWRVHAAWVLVVVLVSAVTWWATSTVLAPSSSDLKSAPLSPTYTAVTGEVGVNTVVQSTVAFIEGPAVMAGSSGTLTSLNVDPAKEIKAGDILASVDLRPVVAAVGKVPAFRDLSLGSRGVDVKQLRAFLGNGSSDYFDWGTRNAVRAWQKSLGMTPDGVVRRGDILFLPNLPARGYVADDIALGVVVSPGQKLIHTVLPEPDILVPGSSGGRQISAGMSAHLAVGDLTLTGTLEGPTRGSDGLLSYRVVDSSGASVCDMSCASHFSIVNSSQIPVQVDIIPTTKGVVVPDAAVGMRPDGRTIVQTPKGVPIVVTVVVSGEGLTIVKGLAVGTVVKLFADAAP